MTRWMILGAVATLGLQSLSAQIQPRWVSRGAGASGRQFFAAAYDSVRARLVVYGGLGANTTILGDTWEWDGATWTSMPGSGPSPRCFHAMAYDRVRQRTVLYGGLDANNQILSDTYEWNGTAWAQMFPATNPGARNRHVATYDPSRQKVVMFGGLAPGFQNLAETWEWDGTDWRFLQTTTTPPARNLHGMAGAERGASIVLFGGEVTTSSSSTYLDDTWVLDSNGWRSVSLSVRPLARSQHGMTYDTKRGRVVLHGGQRPGALADTWEFAFGSWVQRQTMGSPTARFGHVLAYDQARGQSVLFGGSNVQNDTWVYSCPCDLYDRTLPTGGISLDCVGEPLLGTRLCLRAGFSANTAALILGIGRLTPILVPNPIVCTPSQLHLDYLVSLTIPGNQICFDVPNSQTLMGGSFVTQAVGPGVSPGCLALTDALVMTFQ